jgi:hypothetical protein
MAQVVTQLIVDASGAKTGVADFEAAMKRAKGAAVDAGEASASSFDRAQSRWTASLAKTDPIIKAQIAMEKDLARQREISANAVKLGIASQDAANAQIERVRAQHQSYIATLGNVTTATQKMAGQTGLARHELINLSRQAQDVGVSLASGQSPFTVLIQQGSQIADVFASSQGGIRGFFSQAIGWAGRFLTSTAGIVTSLGAIAVGAIYMASQFSRASTTIEEALENQNRLLKEGKALLDARTSTEARAQLQSKEQTQFETLQNQLDLQMKLNQAMEDAANISRRRATRPTEVPNEMGVAPTAFAALSDPGLDKMTAAFVALKEAQAAGLPGLKEYNAELAKIGLAHPELALIVQDMIKAGEAGLQLENAAQRAKAMADALAGIATNAQMAAVGLGSIAQFQVNNLQAEQAAAATERQAVATMQLAQTYPGISVEVAKQLAQHNAQLPVVQAITGAQQMAAQYAADYANALAVGKSQADALAIATMNLEKAQAAATASVLQQVEALKDQNALLKVQGTAQEGRVRAAIAYKNAIASGADETAAAALRSETLKNNMLQARASAGGMADSLRAVSGITATIASDLQNASAAVAGISNAGFQDAGSQGWENRSGSNPSFGNIDQTGPAAGGAVAYSNAGYRMYLARQRLMTDPNVESVTAAPGSYRLSVVYKDLTTAVVDLKDSTDALNKTNQDLLSPYYSQDPRTSKIGFRSQGMASGGYVEVPGAPSANDNYVAMIPMASSERLYRVDPMHEKRGTGRGGSTQNVSIVNNITVGPGANKDEVKRTVYQGTQTALKQFMAASQ